MTKKKNILYFTGEDIHRREYEVERFIRAFQERQNTYNIDTYDRDTLTSWSSVMQDIQSVGLFAEKRLCIFRGSQKGANEKESEGKNTGNGKEKEIDMILMRLCESLSDDTFLLFSWREYDEKSPLHTWLMSNADVRHFPILWDTPSWSSRYPTLDPSTIHHVLSRAKTRMIGESEKKNTAPKEKGTEIELSGHIHQALMKLELLQISRSIDEEDRERALPGETVGNLFGLCDMIMADNPKKALILFREILENTNVHAFLPSFIGLMRKNIYIKYYKTLGIAESKVSNSIQAHPFVIQKGYTSRIEYSKLFIFYEKMLSINIAYRSGKGRKDSELGRIFEIELAIMGLKK